jgi:hypothetical protein
MTRFIPNYVKQEAERPVEMGRGLPVPVVCDDRCDQAVSNHRTTTALNKMYPQRWLLFAKRKTIQPLPYPCTVYVSVYAALLPSPPV